MKYNTIVIDPPWPHRKTGKRSVRPNQDIALDYRTMSLREIREFPINDFSSDRCHLWLWAPDKFLEDALSITRYWGFRKHCVITWIKPTGVCPFSFQFRTEFCIFAYTGKFRLNKIGLPTCFTAPVLEHSRKPDAFYTTYPAQVSFPPMIDIFSREMHMGFDQWGDQIDFFNSA